MGAWTKNKVDSSLINGGQEYSRDSNLSLEQLNAITNNSFYAVDKADEALIKANSAFENNGTIVSIGGSPVLNLSFTSDPQEQINAKANQSDLNATNANVTTNTTNIATNASNIANKANTDASNLTSSNIQSWKDKCSFERVETIYDMSSPDANINLGYTSGIPSKDSFMQISKINLNTTKIFRITLNLYSGNSATNFGAKGLVIEISTIFKQNDEIAINGDVPYLEDGVVSSARFRYVVRIKEGNIYFRAYSGSSAQDSNALFYAITKIESIY